MGRLPIRISVTGRGQAETTTELSLRRRPTETRADHADNGFREDVVGSSEGRAAAGAVGSLVQYSHACHSTTVNSH